MVEEKFDSVELIKFLWGELKTIPPFDMTKQFQVHIVNQL